MGKKWTYRSFIGAGFVPINAEGLFIREPGKSEDIFYQRTMRQQNNNWMQRESDADTHSTLSQNGQREFLSHLKQAIKILIELSGIPKQVVASELGLSHNHLAMILNPQEERRISRELVSSVLRLVKEQPTKLIEQIYKVERQLEAANQMELFDRKFYGRTGCKNF